MNRAALLSSLSAILPDLDLPAYLFAASCLRRLIQTNSGSAWASLDSVLACVDNSALRSLAVDVLEAVV